MSAGVPVLLRKKLPLTTGTKPAAGWIVRLLGTLGDSAIGPLVAIWMVSPALAPVMQAWSVVLQGAAPGNVRSAAASAAFADPRTSRRNHATLNTRICPSITCDD